MKSLIISVLISFGMATLLGEIFIPVFKRFGLGQYIREGAPVNHKLKEGTPSLGGSIFILAALFSVALCAKNIDSQLKFVIYSFVSFGVVGFIDDVLKICHKENEGLKAGQKLLLIVIAAFLATWYIYRKLGLGTAILVPFTRNYIELGIFYAPFIVFFYVSVTNSVNLTDGLDGLAGSVSLLITVFFTIIALYFNNHSIALFSAVLSAAILGFLQFNSYPAKIIMGDTGALAIGGAIAAISIVLKLPLIVILVGGIFLFETSTTLIQIVVFKLSKKRVFKITPIHHSFEVSGYHETNIVTIFSITTVVLCMIGFLSIIR